MPLTLLISDFAYCGQCYRSVVCLYVQCMCVCMFVTFTHCVQSAEDIDTISFARNTYMGLPDSVKIWLTAVNMFLRVTFKSKLKTCLFSLSFSDVEWISDL